MAINIAGSAMSPLAKSMFGLTENVQSTDGAGQSAGVSKFTDILKDQLGQVNDLQQQSDFLTQQMAAGNVDNVEDVLIKAEEARIALDLTVQITSKVTQAYQEIMRMQV